ncbi:MarR family winged helix-turn-helix transcriptional regulator [Microlunatus soli]|uniref:DNA-binding transcriptional regulator, MarR family n=1 Tax=Microlunatus soli TaxID=630515 RepID=A0A1H1PKC6_9ACTN|nr:MarR family transcriptional regulator [Microlunatus soli]SDS11702.1 DNA-binding transcriptional regulator, MarR family [Microlunatus soli]
MPDSPQNPLAEHYADLMAVLPRLTQFGHAMNRGRLVEQALRDGGVSLDRPSMSVLMSLLLADEPLRIGEIARRMQVAGPHVTRLLHDLERRGLARRVSDPADARARLVELTPEGADAANGYVRSIVGWFGDALTDWSPEDLRTLGTLLTRLVDDLNTHVAEAAEESSDEASD